MKKNPAGWKQPVGYLQAWRRIKLRMIDEQIQPVVKGELEPTNYRRIAIESDLLTTGTRCLLTNRDRTIRQRRRL